MAATIAAAQDPRMALKNILHNGEVALNEEASTRDEPAGDFHRPGPTINTGLAYTQACRRNSIASDTSMALAATPSSPTSTHSGDGGSGELWDVWQVHGANRTHSTTDMERKPRAPRPSYSEEQKFYIMYSRVLCDRSWPEIEDGFASIFGGRTKGGLTSIYYRVRKDWGMCEVLKSGPSSTDNDVQAVKQHAANFSREFLTQIGYLHKASGAMV